MKIDKSISIEVITYNLFGNNKWIYNYMMIIKLFMICNNTNIIEKIIYEKIIKIRLLNMYKLYNLNN